MKMQGQIFNTESNKKFTIKTGDQLTHDYKISSIKSENSELGVQSKVGRMAFYPGTQSPVKIRTGTQ